MNLAAKKCVSCEGGMPPLPPGEIQKYLPELGSGWKVLENKEIKKEFTFTNFKAAMAFVNKIAEIAENEGHHPDMHIFYNRVAIELSTHAIGGLSENDFIVAAKINGVIANNANTGKQCEYINIKGHVNSHY